MKTILVLSLFIAVLAFGQRSSIYNLGTLTAVGVSQAVTIGPIAHKHTVQVVVTGAPTACSIQLEGTLDEVNATPTWANLSGPQSCTSSTTFHVADRAVSGVRVNLTALSGGTAPQVQVKYVGVQ